jgi:hypothetical protein
MKTAAMKTTLHCTIILFLFAAGIVKAQTPHFEVKTVAFQSSATGGGYLKFNYYATYVGNTGTTDSVFNGTIKTYYITGKNSKPAITKDSVIAVNLHTGFAKFISDSINVGADYFRNGSNNLIVIWPTGARSGSGVIVGSIDSAHNTQDINITGLTGIRQDLVDNTIKIYPNPASSALMISLADPGLKISKLNVFNIFGQEVFSRTGNIEAIDLYSFKSGTYLVEISIADNSVSRYKLIISR